MSPSTAPAADDAPLPARWFLPESTDGDGSTAPAPPVLLLHGQPGRPSVWREVGDELARRGLMAIALDRPGYGDSDRSAVGFDGNADAIVDFLDRNAIDQVTVVAHSWAGAAALALAIRAPDRVQGIVLLVRSVVKGRSPCSTTFLRCRSSAGGFCGRA